VINLACKAGLAIDIGIAVGTRAGIAFEHGLILSPAFLDRIQFEVAIPAATRIPVSTSRFLGACLRNSASPGAQADGLLKTTRSIAALVRRTALLSLSQI
jgi:hypothetical protein